MSIRIGLKFWLAYALCSAPAVQAAISVNEPNGLGNEEVAEGIEFSTYVKGNRWDMSDPGDVISSESGFLTNEQFISGVYRATTVEDGTFDGFTDAKLFLTFQGLPSSVFALESGQKFPIDTSLYRTLTVKIRHLASNGSPTGTNHNVQVFYFRDQSSISDGTFGFTFSEPVPSDGEWHTVTFDLVSDRHDNSIWQWTDFSEVKGLRIDPTQRADTRVEIDWVRLTAPGDANTNFTVQWSGGSAPFTVSARKQGEAAIPLAGGLPGTSASVDFSILPPGNYSVEVSDAQETGTGGGNIHVNEAPLFHFLQPDIGGDISQRYSLIEAGNPWGPMDAGDIFQTGGLSGIDYSNPAGTLTATTTGSDSRIILNTPESIDTTKYRMLSFTLSVSGERDIGAGSVARVFWGDSLNNMKTSEDIIIQEGLNTYEIGDLHKLPVEGGAAGEWQGFPAFFRLDPHEFPNAKLIRLDDVTLAPPDTAAPAFNITWQDSDTEDDATIDLYVDEDQIPGNFNELLIAEGLGENSAIDNFEWNAFNDVVDGEYFLYAVIDDGLNQTARYATGPIAVGDGVPIDVNIIKPDGVSDAVMSSDEFSREVEGNEWDMSDSGDVPLSRSGDIGSQSIVNGLLSGTSTGNDSKFYLLYPGATSGHTGSNGQVTPIDTLRFRYLTFKVRYAGSGSPLLQVFFLKNQTFEPQTVGFTNFRTIQAGAWQVITIDLEAETAPGSPFSWPQGGMLQGLRIDPANSPGESWQFDWITLTGEAGPGSQYQVRWSAADPGQSTLNLFAIDSEGFHIPMVSGVDPSAGSAFIDLRRLPIGSYFAEIDAIPGPTVLSTGPISLVRDLGVPENELRNIATRTDVRTGDNITIGGFIITGSASKCVVLQGLGASVAAPAGVARLLDPVLTLKSGQTTIAQNDNWQLQNNPSDATIIANLGRAPGDILEAAIYKCLTPGAYTALLTGFLNSTGVGMVAVYDADNGAPYLSNIATRSWVGTGDRVSIAGFVITGDQPKQILVRGLGPSMQSKFPPGSQILMDPQLKLFHNSTLIATNDNWGDAPNAAEVAALSPSMRPADSREPAILIVLQPGLYTAHLLGVALGTGNGNVAVYDLTGRQ
jgi:hypothetical protein